jgi:hypothetical protein
LDVLDSFEFPFIEGAFLRGDVSHFLVKYALFFPELEQIDAA